MTSQQTKPEVLAAAVHAAWMANPRSTIDVLESQPNKSLACHRCCRDGRPNNRMDAGDAEKPLLFAVLDKIHGRFRLCSSCVDVDDMLQNIVSVTLYNV
jgi:hypothetical protein